VRGKHPAVVFAIFTHDAPRDLVELTDGLGLHGPAAWMRANDVAATLIGIAFMLVAALGVFFLVRRVLLRAVADVAKRTKTTWDDLLVDGKLLHRITWAVPWIVAYETVGRIPHASDDAIDVFRRLASCALVLVALRSIAAFLRIVETVYSRYPSARNRPIKGYLQIFMIVASLFGAIIMISVVLDRSPWLLLSGLGAMTAVLLLVFRDTLLSLVAGIRITTNDLIRVGDWIEMPQFAADGDVVEIALHAIKVQNWDRTFSVIPTHAFLEHSFRNWRGMTDSGGRRIKRPIYVDMTSIRFLSPDEVERFKSFDLLHDYIESKQAELEAWNETRPKNRDLDVNARRLTNVGTLRAYIGAYLRHHPAIHQEMTLLVRQLAPTAEGLPIEIYAFSREIGWAAYEGVQADIFDHILAVVPAFGLRIFQTPTGSDFASLAALRPSANAPAPRPERSPARAPVP
jgi:miniconductance mechanosensitive channel